MKVSHTSRSALEFATTTAALMLVCYCSLLLLPSCITTTSDCCSCCCCVCIQLSVKRASFVFALSAAFSADGTTSQFVAMHTFCIQKKKKNPNINIDVFQNRFLYAFLFVIHIFQTFQRLRAILTLYWRFCNLVFFYSCFVFTNCV